jgi:hypothetical protein
VLTAERVLQDWKAKAAGRFAEKKEALSAGNAKGTAKAKVRKAGARVSKLRKEVKDRAAEVKNDSPKAGRLSKLRGRREDTAKSVPGHRLHANLLSRHH